MIVIPMAGASRRFTEAGYDLPKYMLEAHGKSLFRHSVESFSDYFASEPFLFIARKIGPTAEFLEAELRTAGIKQYQVVMLDAPTSGQAETVVRGLEGAIEQGGSDEDQPLTIFNIDTFRSGFRYPGAFEVGDVDGYLETFIGSGANWSNVVPADGEGQRVVRTAEKQQISEYCCTGLYYFRSSQRFRKLFDAEVEALGASGAETYVAPMYNRLIDAGADVRYSVVEPHEVIFCGVPAEYEEFLATEPGN